MGGGSIVCKLEARELGKPIGIFIQKRSVLARYKLAITQP